VEVARQVLARGDIDYLDMSLWDVFKAPMDAPDSGPLIDHFAALPRGETRLGVAGKLMSAELCRKALEHGADFPILGRAAILHHDFPLKVAADPGFQSVALPVTRAHLRAERLGPVFVDYMASWKGFVAEEPAEAAA
jgi:2,4-dienoyl-CoA reductase-like NADH-dependent reductase (Old Yellow Enzyme family)